MRVAAMIWLVFFSVAGLAQESAAASAAKSDSGNQQAREFDWKSLKKYRAAGHSIFDSSNMWDGRDSVCYTMRSYLVTRLENGSDETEVVRSTTCTPASAYNMRNAEIRGK